MGFRLPRVVDAKKILRRVVSTPVAADVPKGHVAVYVGETERKRFIVPVQYLNHPWIRSLLSQAEEEFGFEHPMGGLTIPCTEESFTDLICSLRSL